MVYAQLDNRFHDHPKVLALLDHDEGLAAIGLWTLTITWAHSHIDPACPRDAGQIPASLPRRLGGTDQLCKLLIAVGLWEATADGWQIHDFGTRQDITGWRARTDKARKAANTRWNARSNAPSNAPSNAHNPPPAPPQYNTEQEQGQDLMLFAGFDVEGRETIIHESSSGSETAIRTTLAGTALTRIPADFTVDQGMAAYAQQHRPDVDWRTETERFISYWTAKPGKAGEKADWKRAWRNWISRARAKPGYAVNGRKLRSIAPESWD